MKNKGRKHLATTSNCKGELTFITRGITKMGKNTRLKKGKSNAFVKRKWQKRMRGYFKSQTKDLLA